MHKKCILNDDTHKNFHIVIGLIVASLCNSLAARSAETSPVHTNSNIQQHIQNVVHPNHHALVGQTQQHVQSVHAVINSAHTQAAQANLIGNHLTFYSGNTISAMSNNHHIQTGHSSATFANLPHMMSQSLSTGFSSDSQHYTHLHQIPHLQHVSMVGNETRIVSHHPHPQGSVTQDTATAHHASSVHGTDAKTEPKTEPKTSNVATHQFATAEKQYLPQPGTVSTNQLPQTLAQARNQITQVIRGDFSSWTGGKNKPLTLATVGALLKDPKITGSQAAVLGVIADKMNGEYVSKHNLNLQFSYSQLSGLIQKGWHVTDGKAVLNTGGSFTHNYMNAMAQISTAHIDGGRISLYGAAGKPEIKDIIQGPVNDCYFVSTIETLLNKDPKLISNMIKQNDNGTFTVKFANGQSQTVRLTAGEVAEFSLAKNNGAWLAVLGLAEAQVRAGSNPVKNDTPMGNTIDAGYQSQAMTLLTGITYESIKNSTASWNVGTIEKLLTTAFSEKQPVGVSSNDHALAILDWNAQTGQVTIQNPWGTSGKYTPEASNPSQFVMETDGKFTLPLNQVLQMFRQITAPASLISQAEGGTALASGGTASGAVNTRASFLPVSATMVMDPKLNVLTPASTLPTSHHTSGTYTASLPNETSRSPIYRLNAESTTTNSLAISNAQAQSLLLKIKQPSICIAQQPDLDEATHTNPYCLKEGTLFVCSKQRTVVRTPRADVTASPDCAVFIVNLDSEVGVYNLHDCKRGTVTISLPDGQVHIVPVGHALILADKDKSAGALQLPGFIGMARLEESQCSKEQKIFSGLFSYASAFANCAQFSSFRKSDLAQHRWLTAKVMKTAAAVTTMTVGKK